jgi:hypothetical protein
MSEYDRARVAFHGAIILLVGLLCGIPAVTEPEGMPMPSWQAAHGGLLLNGIWLLAVSGVLPRLVLDRQSARALLVSLIGMAYGFMSTVLVQAATGVRGISPEGPAVNWIAFAGNLFVVLCGFFAAALTVMGARAALRAARREEQSAVAVPG